MTTDATEYLIIENGSFELSSINRDNIRYFYDSKRGLGRALKVGIQQAKYNDIFFFGIDLPIDSEAFINRVKESPGDIVSASKRHPDSIVHRPFYRNWWTAVSTELLKADNSSIPREITDIGSAGRYFRRDKVLPLLDQCPADGLLFDSQLLNAAGKAGLKLIEVPCEVHDRTGTTLRWLH